MIALSSHVRVVEGTVYVLESACVSFVGREGSRKLEKKGYFYRVSAFRPAPSSE